MSGQPFRIEMPEHPVVRILFIAFGIFIIGISIYELGRGVWPLNVTSPFFLLLILGACTVGGPTILGGLFGWSTTWDIAPGLITISQRNPFQRKMVRLRRSDVLGLQVVERESSEGENTWAVQLTTSTDRFRTYDFSTRMAAEDLLGRVNRAFSP